MRRGAAVVALVLGLLSTAPAAGALETGTFGVAPGAGARTEAGTERLVLRPPRGGSATSSIRVWNRTDRALRLRLSAEAASIRPDGAPELGGDGRAAGWMSFDPGEVSLDPHASVDVVVRVAVPRRAGTGERTAAVVVEPAATGSAPAVLQRLALVVYVRPGGDGGFGWWAWTAATALALALVGGGVVASRTRRRNGSRPE